MDVPKKAVAQELLKNLYLATHDENIQAMIASLKSEMENLNVSDDMFVEERVKGPISTLKKYEDKSVYHAKWNNMKDIIGLMVVVDNNDQVDQVIQHIVDNHSDEKNPNSEYLFQDFRRKNVRKESRFKDSYQPQDPTGRAYQTNDGYKNVRANLMIKNFPVEIQIKTKAQYIAHDATHDPIYKSPILKNEEERNYVSDKFFPYFEANAYLRLNRDKLSEEEIMNVKKDISEILDRNKDIYEKYAPIFNSALATYAVSFYMLQHKKEIMKDEIVNIQNVNSKLAEVEVERVFKYFQKQTMKSMSLTGTEAMSQTIDKLISLPYEQFKEIKENIAEEYRLDACTVTGTFDTLRETDVKFINELNKNFRKVHVGVYDDELAKAYLGRSTIYSTEERIKQMANVKHVASVFEVSNGHPEVKETIGFLENPPKEYAVAYVSGVFDGFHPGHQEHLKMALSKSEKLYVGVKSNDYVVLKKHKDPVVDEKERLFIVESQKGITGAYITDKDITPIDEILNEMESHIENDEKCAIFIGSDWFNDEKLATKPASSLEELVNLKKDHPNIVLTTTPRPEQGMSSTSIRSQLVESINDPTANPYEVREFGEDSFV